MSLILTRDDMGATDLPCRVCDHFQDVVKAQAQYMGKELLKMSQRRSTVGSGLNPYDIEEWLKKGGIEL
jgi:hypothetical protein